MKFEFPAKMPTLFLPGLFSPHFANWAGLCSSTLVILYLFSMVGEDSNISLAHSTFPHVDGGHGQKTLLHFTVTTP
jgi:hypothetical protein